MLKERRSFTVNCQRFVDLGITGFSFLLAYGIKKFLLSGEYKGLSTEPNYYLILLLAMLSWHISLNWMGMYGLYFRKNHFRQYFTTILKSCCLGIFLLSLAMYAMHIQEVSRVLISIFFFLNIFFLAVTKYGAQKILKKVRARRFNTKNVIIVGSGNRAKDVIAAVTNQDDTRFTISACFEVDSEKLGQPIADGYRVTGLVKDLEEYMQTHVVDELIFATQLKGVKDGDRYIELAETLGIKVRIVPDWELHHLKYYPNLARVAFGEFLGIYNMTLQFTPPNEGELLLKSAFDLVVATLLTILLSPLLLGIAIAIKFFSQGPALYTQERLGQYGRKFMVYKFRTMVEGADELLKELAEMNEADGPVFKIKNDPRIIPWVGTFLRKTSLDELPQLFNVLKGEMSLVGPRPPIPKEVDEYSIWQRRRLSMKPGMTCLWQIAPHRNELSFEDWIQLDLQYIDTWSIFNDIWILVLTARAVLTGAGQ